MTSARLFPLLLLLYACSAHAIDWGRLLHGAPPKAPAPKQIAIVTVEAGVAPDAGVESFLRAFAQALKARDAQDVLPRLSARYSIDGLPDRAKAPDVFAQAVEQLPGPSEFAVQAIERHAGELVAKVQVRYPSAPPQSKTLRFDATGQLLWSDLFKVQANGS
jgi:hypothetical protein